MKLIAPLAAVCLCSALLSGCGRSEPSTRAAGAAAGGGDACCTPAAQSQPAGAAAVKAVDPVAVMDVRLPKPVIIGTPKDVKNVRLDPNAPKIDEKTARQFVQIPAPPGTRNVAAGKPVSSSDSEPIIGSLKMVTDGDREGGDGSYVELGPGLQWVQIDLGSPHELDAILVWHYHGAPRVYRAVIVQVSDDPDFVSGVTTLFNNDHENRAGLGLGTDYEYFDTYEGKVVAAKGAKARYVRLYSKGNTSDGQNHYTEVEVYGRPGK